MFSDESVKLELGNPRQFHFSPELLDSISGFLLQLCEEVDDQSFSNSVILLLQAFDGETLLNQEHEELILTTLHRLRKTIGLNSYCLLKGILFYHKHEPEKLEKWFRLIAMNSLEGHEYTLYQIMAGNRMN
jgi:hypothetical protein